MKPLFPTWRWFGPSDPIPLAHIRQAGARGIVTALHHMPLGEVWTDIEVEKRKSEIEAAGLIWSVVESIPVTDAIKLGGADCARDTENWIASLRAVAAAGVKTICYNFMPVLDWTRTDLAFPTRTGATALRYDALDMGAWDAFCLKRQDAPVTNAIRQRFESWDQGKADAIEHAILCGLPGADRGYNLDEFRAKIAAYDGLGRAGLKKNLSRFLQAVVPVAQELGVHLAIHPDDPPFEIFGLPRVVSVVQDYEDMFAAAPAINNGFTLCTGSLGARADNDLPAIAKRFADRAHFIHLRNVSKDEDGSFMESNHLEGDVDMVAVIRNLMSENTKRSDLIPYRPDHGHAIGADQQAGSNPGYTYIGRLRGMAEIEGIMKAL